MADIIEEIGDLIGEEDKGDIRTASRTVEANAADEDGNGAAGKQLITIKDLVSVEDIVAVKVTKGGDPATFSAFVENSVPDGGLGATASSSEDNVVTVSYKTIDNNGVSDAGGPSDITELDQVKVIARGY